MKVIILLFFVAPLLASGFAQAEARNSASQIGFTPAVDCSVGIELSEGMSASETLKDSLQKVGQVMCMDEWYYLRTPKLLITGVSDKASCVFEPIEDGSRILIDTSRPWKLLELIACVTISLEAFRVEVDIANGYYSGYKICPNAQVSHLAMGGFNRMVWSYNSVNTEPLNSVAVDDTRRRLIQSVDEAIESCLLADKEAI